MFFGRKKYLVAFLLPVTCDSRSNCRKDQLKINSRVGVSGSAAACDVREWVVVTFRAEIIWSLDNFFQTINRSKDNGFNGNYELS